MAKRLADVHIVRQIRKLSNSPGNVQITRSASYSMMSYGLKKEDICEAICDWIDENKEVEEIITKYAQGHLGERAYVMKLSFGKIGFYVKVAIRQLSSDENLLIISCHPKL